MAQGGIRMVSENFEKFLLTFLGLGTNVVKVISVNSELLFQWDTLLCMARSQSAWTITDSQLTTPNLDATGHCWVSALASYNFDLVYLKGTENRTANVLTQVPVPPRQGASESDLLDDDSENEDVAGPANESYSSKDPKERVSHWDSSVVKTVLEGTQVRTQNLVDRPQEGPDSESEA